MKARANTPLRGVLFDWDGTLLNSYAADSAAYLAMFREMEIPWGLAELERHYSPDWYNVYRAANLPREKWRTAEKLWRVHYARHAPELLPGARRVLSLLARRHALGLVTSGDRERVHRQLRAFRLWERFRARVCREDTAAGKPDPAPLRLAMRHMDLRPSEAVYVGTLRKIWRWPAAPGCGPSRCSVRFPPREPCARPGRKCFCNRSRSFRPRCATF